MPTITPYTPDLVLPNYKTTNYDTSLEFAILGKKQQEYNQVLSRLNNLRSTSLNISMINEEGRKKLDQYNQEINNTLNSDLGDLSDAKNQARVASMFQRIASDDDLKRRSHLSRYYQDQLSIIDGMQKSKDPAKSGYNSINDFVFRNWEGGLNDFIVAKDINGWETKQQRYVPFKDIDQKMVNLTKLLHADSQTSEGPIPNAPGYSLLETEKGVSADKIRTLFQSSLDQDEIAQIDVLSKYRILQMNSPEGKSSLYESYNSWIKGEKDNIQKKLDMVTAYKKQFDPKKLDSKLSPEERTQKEEEYTMLQKMYSEQEQQLKEHLLKAEQNSITPDEWAKFDTNDMLPYVSQMMMENYVNGISEALSWKETVKKAGIDNAYFADRKMDIMEQRLVLDGEIAKTRLALEKAKSNSENQNNNFSAPVDIFKSPETAISSWENFIETEKQYSRKTADIITSENFNPAQLKDQKWLEQNADNYEVKLWNGYKAKAGEEASLNGFRAFKAQVINGDFKNDPYVSLVISEYSRDKDIAQYYTEVAQEVTSAVNNQLRSDEIKLEGGQYSLGDYARVNGWNGTGEMSFGLPDGKGGYKQYTWSEIKKEYEKRKPSWGDLIVFPAAGLVINPFYGQKFKQLYIDQIFSEDPYFFRLVGKAVEQEQKSQTVLQDVMMNKLPQHFQGKQLVALDDKTRTSAIGQINQAIKLSSEDNPVSIDPTQVTNVSIPYGVGSYGGFSITEKEAERLKSAGAKIVTVGGELKDPKPNVWYKVPMQTTLPFDAVYNDIFERKGNVNRIIEGKQVRISKIPGYPYVNLTIDNESRTVPRKDINQMFAEVEFGLKQLQTTTPK